MSKVYSFLTLISLLISFNSYSQYNIKVHIDGLKDSTIYLGNYFGDKQYAKDTAKLDSKGNAVFSNKKMLDKGVYFILLPGNIIFELLIDKEQVFSVNAKYDTIPSNVANSVSAKGNSDMVQYVEYQQFMNKKSELAIDLRKRVNDSSDEAIKQNAKDSLQILHEEVKANWERIHKESPGSILSAILNVNKEVEIPEPPKDENGKETDDQFRYKYYKAHYFDYVDFSDDRILRSQFYHPKIERYFKQLVVPAPDSIIKECAYVLKKAEANEEIYQYTLSMLFNKYNSSKVMGMDKVFVFLAENYYLNGQAEWADSAWLSKVRKRVIDIKPNIIGNRAADIKYYTNNNEYRSLYMIDAEYTIVFFYEPGCGHCKRTTGELKPITDKFWEKGVEVLAMYTQTEKEEWDKFIEEKDLHNWHNGWDPNHQSGFRQFYDVYATPLIYLLDKDKNIVAKRIDPETLELILNEKYGIESDKKAEIIEEKAE